MTSRELFDREKLWKLVDIIFHGEHSAQAYLDVEAFIQSECRRNRVEGAEELAVKLSIYIIHLSECSIFKSATWSGNTEHGRCDCGLDKAIALLQEVRENEL